MSNLIISEKNQIFFAAIVIGALGFNIGITYYYYYFIIIITINIIFIVSIIINNNIIIIIIISSITI